MSKKVKINVKTTGGYDVLHPETEAGQVQMTGYVKPASASAVTAADTVNMSIGKLEKGIEGCIPKANIAQVRGRSETMVMSQKATTDAIEAGGGGGGAGDAEPVGVIKPYGGETLPDGYLWCDGASYPANGDYAKLHEVIGERYNAAGDAVGTFRVPDLRGRVAVGKNAGTFDIVGKTGGEETHKLTVSEMPSHKHAARYGSASQTAQSGSAFVHTGYDGENTVQINTTGGDQHHNNLQPYLVCNYIIKYSKSYGEIGITAPPCMWEFAAADWAAVSGGYALSIPESEHKRGEYCVLTALYDTSEAGKMKAVLPETEKNSAGDITIYSDTAFAGVAYIDRVYMAPAGRVLTVNGQGPDVDGDVTVPQSESGSNANGSYIKFPDGTMICWKDVAVTVVSKKASSLSGWYTCEPSLVFGAWPVPFTETPAANLNIQGTSASYTYSHIQMNGSPATATSAGSIWLATPNQAITGYTITGSAVGYGRWK